jgi:hypothetical protein
VAIEVTRNKILACIIDAGSMGDPVTAEGCKDRNTVAIRQITAITRQAIPNQ